MPDFLILLAMYLVAMLLGGTGLYFLLKKEQRKMPEKPKLNTIVSAEDMLPGWGKEEEEASR
ncbi:MAG: hypothetical protein AB7D24_10455 [Sphaerochaeta sp.]|jgi:hypothetical protein|uniref:hypothetical protein n=1 Tax=Sphaerochaeta sp. TaxID=1972642 RepID=UPI000A8B5713|nr:hypothetical protein [Sphaerochaeta sp.]NLE16253.1 hypothetical protein [Spirochaetales bacterium]MCK9601507.1 hypothetical protein [Sphaerochaeta sp.]MDD3058273.1 hypothetical protein [Sphaerochaeta sp.]MDX9824951.1 hypothetical protein [Sphaerochaeta sp.]HCU30645.1 hypothetical protein [Sphaerochaeta sp.]